MRVLVATPNQSLAQQVLSGLELAGYAVDWVSDGPAALEAVTAQTFHVLVLAMRMPKLDGIAVCRRLRQELGSDVPVVLWQDDAVLSDTLVAFRNGADDVVRADTALEELQARVQALARRRAGLIGATVLRVGNLTYDFTTLEVQLAGRRCLVSPVTRRLLVRLMKDSPRMVSNTDLKREIWGEEVPSGGSLRAHISTLRQAIACPAGSVRLQTIRGSGYRLAGRVP